MTLSYSELSWHQQQAFNRAAAAIISGKPDVQHGYRNCDCCGVSGVGPLDDDPFKCDGCEDGCDPAETWHCFTGYCDGSGCSYDGECMLGRWFEPEFTYEAEDRPGLKVEVMAVGGGTVGRAYDFNDWKFRVSRDDEPFYATEARSNAAPKTHEQMARDVLDYMETSHVIPEAV